MTTWMEGKRSFFLGAQAAIIEDDREIASSWVSKHVVRNPAYKWVVGRFVEADRANNNRQLFALEGLQMARPTIQHAPMNMNHSARRVVGSYVATELIYPTAGGQDAAAGEPCPKCGEPMPHDGGECSCLAQLATLTVPTVYSGTTTSPTISGPFIGGFTTTTNVTDSDFTFTIPENLELPTAHAARQLATATPEFNPYIEALGVFWKHYFPEEYQLVANAHAEGRLYYSMECIPAEIQCAGEGGCGMKFEYAGRQSPTYCSHLNESSSDKFLIGPHFTAGALLVPPVRPGWSHADVHSLVASHADLAERIYEGVKADLSHLEPAQWEALMFELLAIATH